MTSKPQEFTPSKPKQNEATSFSDNVVISGMAGLYPESYDVKQLSEILYNKINPIKKTNRWKYNHPEVAQYNGHMPDLSYFDAQFFKVHYRLSNNMDAMARKVLEQAYQAIYDAGFSPEHLSGKKVGVFIGTCFSETEKASFYVTTSRTGFGIAGCNKSMFANRISYWLNVKGPSMSIDVACCSSTAAVELAYSAIARGDCEAAIVGGTSLCLHPQSSVHYERIMKLSKDGKTKSFDMNAGGCAKSEAINVLFLQKAKDALRIYAYVVHAKSEYTALVESETGPKYGFYRNPKDTAKFLNSFYNEANISPHAVQYVEAFGSAVPEADKSELEAIDEVFCKSRSKPLLVGSVMSNIGYGEASSGISAITKVLLGYHFGKLASNLHYENPRIDLPALKDGRVEILQENKEFDRTYVAVNSMSITGVNAHVLLHGYCKPKDINRYKSSIPRLVLLSGRQESSVKKIIHDLKSRPIDPEEHALLHNIHETRIPGHLGRGFVILDTNDNNETECLCEVSDYFDQGKRPLWFVYSGMGSQWAGMGKHLIRIPVFAAAIERCHRVLEPKGVNIVDIITSDDKKMFDNILHSFVGINAIQIGLTDILHELEIYPDNIIGHSLGEIGCAYADGCFTIEETILCAYSRGLVSIQTPFIRGSMAAVGLGYKEISKLCPPEVEVACHNSPDSSTISGPAEVMSEFVASLTNKGIFAKEVPCSNIAYHSRYIADAGPGLLQYMKELITSPKLRSARWLSTSVPQDKWDEPFAKYCSAEYHTNNLLSSVLFEETSRLIPPDAVLIEIAPHGLLQAILKRSLPQSCRLLPLTQRAHTDNVRFLLEAVGRLSMEGFQPKVKALYPNVEFPVSTSTPMLSHLVEWAHNEKWTLPLYASANRKTASACKYIISTYEDEHSYLKGHVIGGKNQYPFAAALVFVWDTLAMTLNLKPKSISVQFRDVFLHSQPILHKHSQLHISTTLQRGTGQFEVLNGNSLMMNGFITTDVDTNKRHPVLTSQINISGQDVYRMFNARDYNYGQDFRSIHSVNESLTEAKIEWKHNWVTFIDGILQLNILKRNHNGISKLASIRKLVIDVEKQASESNNTDEVTLFNANLMESYDSTVCGSVVVENITFVDLPVLNEDPVVLNTLKFIPFFPDDVADETCTLYLFLQVVFDNIKNKEMNILEIVDTESDKSEFNKITNVIYNIPGVKANYYKTHKMNISREGCISLRNCNLLLVSKLFTDDNLYHVLTRVLPNEAFIINKQTSKILKSQRPALYNVISEQDVGEARLELAIWSHGNPNSMSKLAIRSPKNVSSLSLTEKFGGEYYLPFDYAVDIESDSMLKIKRIGDLNSLKWVEATPNNSLYSGVDVQVKYAGINVVAVNKFLKTSLCNDNDQTNNIIDFSGITKSGTRVMGVVRSDSIASRLKTNSEFLWPVPAHWSLEDAATVPLAYSLAFYILFIKAELIPRYKVCVQGGAGALGQAIISIALAHGCEVFTSVSTNVKRQLLRKLFPKLKDDHIGNSRDVTFGDMVLNTTKGEGCELVICCSKGEMKDVYFKCCAEMGYLLDMTLMQNHEDYKFGMNKLARKMTYFTVDFATVFQPKYSKEAKYLQTLMIEGIACGYVRPLSRVTFAPEDAARAFRLQAACANRGRVLLDLRQIAWNVSPRLTCSSSSWQLLIADMEIITLKLAERLIKQGAKKIVLLLNNPSKYVHVQLRFWREVGVEIKLVAHDIWNETTLSDVIQDCERESSLESLLLIMSNKKAENITNYIKKCTRIVQKSCISLRHFSVISPDSITISESGLQNIKLPEAMLTMQNEESISKHNYLSINYIIDILEKALCSKHKIVLAHISSRPRVPLWQQLLQIADIKGELPSQNVTDDLKLKDLTKDYVKFQTIQGYLHDVYDICLKIEEIEMLSVKILKYFTILAVFLIKGFQAAKEVVQTITTSELPFPYKMQQYDSLIQEKQKTVLYRKMADKIIRASKIIALLEECCCERLVVQRINELEKETMEYDFEEINGIGSYISNVDSDDLMSTTEMVFLPTLATFSSMRDDEFDVTQTYLCIVPGVEGLHTRFHRMCEGLKLPALVLQPGFNLPNETVTEMANRYAHILLTKTELKKKFYLLGYESGVLVALEMAAILEENGLTGTVFCIGGSPSEILADFKYNLRDYQNSEQLQIAVLKHMYTLMTNESTEILNSFMYNSLSWHEKVNACVQNLLGKTKIRIQYAKELIETAYARLALLLQFTPKSKILRSQLISLRPRYSTCVNSSLKSYSYQEIISYQLQTPLSFATQDLMCTAIINRYLDNDIMEKFNNRNLCESYLENATTFMTSEYDIE